MKQETENKTIYSEIEEKIRLAINSDEQLSAGAFYELRETTRDDNPCSRTFYASVSVLVRIPK